MLVVDAFIVSLLVCAVYSQTTNPIVDLQNGRTLEGEALHVDVRGKTVQVNQFLGIKYAEQQRFAKPQRYNLPEGKTEAKKLPRTCWQMLPGAFELHNKGALMWYNNTVMDEDCLYLNVWAPANTLEGEEKMPVMVWIYGGGFFSGTSTLDVYNGSILAATQNVIVVSMQYRVGAFGFLRIPGPETNDDVGLGNEGLWDQTMALEWVRDNIKYFKGDKLSVTIFGESAGAASVSALWLSPHSRGLFKRAIMQSASIYARWAHSTVQDAEKRSKKFIEVCNCNPNDNRKAILECLQKVNVETLVNNLFNISDLIYAERDKILQQNLKDSYSKFGDAKTWAYLYFDAPLRPVIDGDFLPSDPQKMLEERKSEDTPELLMGVNKNEGMYFVLYGYLFDDVNFLMNDGKVVIPEELVKHHQKGDLVWASIAKFIDEDWMTKKLAQKPAEHYRLRKEDEAKPGGEELMERMDALTGDLDFICPTLKFAEEASSKQKAKVYFYSFEKRTAKFPMPDWVGVMHGYEIEYVFGMPRSDKFKSGFYNFNGKEKKVSDNMMKMWANFARSGNPIPNDKTFNFEWPTYEASSAEPQQLIISDQPTPGKIPKKKACEFWWNKGAA